jgi:outer membrane lipoprotein
MFGKIEGRNSMRVFILFLFLTFVGCTHPISKNMRATLDPSVSVSGLFESPDAYVGKRVMMGGNIIKTRNSPDQSDIEVVQKSIDSYGNLDTGDATLGRFIFRHRGYLESEVYTKGRDVIGAGVIVGSQSGKIGDRDYLFPVIEPEELNLLRQYPDYYPYYPYYYDPFYPYYYGYPYRHHHLRHRYW